MKQKNKFNNLFSFPMIAVLIGFGTFSFYQIFTGVVWFSIFIGLYVTSLITMLLIKYKIIKIEGD